MAKLPDQFDLWVRKAKSSADPARQADWILGALIARKEIHFVNIGTKAAPLIAKTAIAMDECVLAFTDRGRIDEFIAEHPTLLKAGNDGPPVISSPSGAALAWCVENRAGLVLNPGEGETAMIPWAQLAAFTEEWRRHAGRQPTRFWMPNLTSDEEGFWQEHGL